MATGIEVSTNTIAAMDASHWTRAIRYDAADTVDRPCHCLWDNDDDNDNRNSTIASETARGCSSMTL